MKCRRRVSYLTGLNLLFNCTHRMSCSPTIGLPSDFAPCVAVKITLIFVSHSLWHQFLAIPYQCFDPNLRPAENEHLIHVKNVSGLECPTNPTCPEEVVDRRSKAKLRILSDSTDAFNLRAPRYSDVAMRVPSAKLDLLMNQHSRPSSLPPRP